MIWQNPWAWWGLVAVVLPILIHLLGRGHTQVRRFPTLRFLETSRLLPTRRTRLHDLVLLAVRVAILAAAVAALAQPLLLTGRRARLSPLARAIIVDSSASMRRLTPSNEMASDAANRIASALVDSAQSSVVLESAYPAAAIAGAAAWLLTQPARGEIDIISDFQSGTVDARDLSVVPPELGIHLARIAVRQDSLAGRLLLADRAVITAHANPRPDRTDVSWNVSRASAASARSGVQLLAGQGEQSGLAAAEQAAATIGVALPVDTSRAITILYPDAPGRAALLRAAAVPARPWMTALVAKLSVDSLLLDAAARAVATSADGEAPALVVARTSSGLPVVSAVQASTDGRQRLVLVSFVDPGTLPSAALIAAVDRAESTAPPATELEPTTLSDDVIAGLQRPTSPAAASRAKGSEGPSDARWFWLSVLLLIALETVLRRYMPARQSTVATPASPTLDTTSGREHVA